MGQWDDSQNPDDRSTPASQPTSTAPNLRDQGLYDSVARMYQSLLGRPPENPDVIWQHIDGRQGNIYAIQQDIAGSDEAKSYADSQKPKPPPTPHQDPLPTPGPTQTPPDIYSAPLTKPYGGTFTAPAPVDLGGPAGTPPVPTFTGANAPPQLGAIPKFQAPSVADALNDPGYQFRRDQGMYGVQNAAAARGTLNDSSTFKALSDYNQNAASQEYDQIWNRALGDYQTNTQTQYLLPFQANEQNWMASVVNPQMAGYTTQAGAVQHQNDMNYSNAWSAFLNGQSEYNNWQDRTWNKLFQAASY